METLGAMSIPASLLCGICQNECASSLIAIQLVVALTDSENLTLDKFLTRPKNREHKQTSKENKHAATLPPKIADFVVSAWNWSGGGALKPLCNFQQNHIQIPHANTAAFLLRLVPVHLLMLFPQKPNFMVFGYSKRIFFLLRRIWKNTSECTGRLDDWFRSKSPKDEKLLEFKLENGFWRKRNVAEGHRQTCSWHWSYGN